MNPREQLEALAGSTVYVNGAEYSADTIEPKTFAALRAVLDELAKWPEPPESDAYGPMAFSADEFLGVARQKLESIVASALEAS